MTKGRRLPNILITGTPGTGKTTTSELLAIATELTHLNVGDRVKLNSLHDGWDEDYHCYILDEDKVCDDLEPLMMESGNVLDFHSCDFFPERWFDLVVVLRADTNVLHPRLETRGYADKKVNENVTAEIMQVVLEEARASYQSDIVWELTSNTVEDMERNVERIRQWALQWMPPSPSPSI